MKYLHVVAGQVLGWWSSNLGVCVERGGEGECCLPHLSTILHT